MRYADLVADRSLFDVGTGLGGNGGSILGAHLFVTRPSAVLTRESKRGRLWHRTGDCSQDGSGWLVTLPF